ncbi:MAG: glycoside hydrolase family 2 TIM barrel-domain containing protein [Armatimonadota bacterium]
MLTKTAVFCIIWVIYCAISAAGMRFPSPTRNEVSLAGDWQSRTMPDDKPSYPPPADGWRAVQVPGTLGGTSPGDRVPSVFLKRDVIVPANFRGRHVRLEFDSVSRWCKVYINGKYLGENFSDIVPFSFDVTDKVKYGASNEVLLWMTPEVEPRTATDAYGGPVLPGISRRAAIVSYPTVWVEDVFVKPSFRKKSLTVDFTLVNSGNIARKVTLDNSVVIWTKDMNLQKARPVISLNSPGVIVLKPGERRAISLTQPWSNAHTWSHEDPFLYVLRTDLIRLSGGRHAADSVATRFGFREFWIDGTRLMLNGVQVHLWGTWTGSGRRFFEVLRRSNMNAIRCPHNPHGFDPGEYDDADEMGILICSQNAALGFSSPYRDRPEFWNNMEDVYRRAVRRDRNHPSIVIWSMSNEWVQTAGDNWQQQVDGLWRLQSAVRREDPTRPAFQSGSGALNGRGGVISLHYPRELVYGGPVIGYGTGNMPEGAYWMENAKEFHSAWLQYNEPAGTKPVIISESTHIWPAFQDFNDPSAYYYWSGESAFEYAHQWWEDNRTTKMWADAFRESQVGHFPMIAAIRDADAGGLLVNGDTPNFVAYDDGLSWAEPNWARAFAPVVVNCRQMDHRFFIGDKVRRTLTVHNDLMVGKSDVLVRWEAKVPFWKRFASGEHRCKLAGGERERFEIEFAVADMHSNHPFCFELFYEVYVNGKEKFEEAVSMTAYPRTYPTVGARGPVALFDPADNTASVLEKLGVSATKIDDIGSVSYPTYSTLVIGKDSLQGTSVVAMARAMRLFTSAGGFVVILEQKSFPAGLLPVEVAQDSDISLARFATTTSILAPNHPVMDKLTDEDFRFWRGDHFLVRNALKKPLCGNFVPLLGNGNASTPAVDRTSLLEIRCGKGGYMLSQLLLVEKFETEPLASVVLANILNYAESSTWRMASVGTLLSGGELGKQTAGYLSRLGMEARPVTIDQLDDVKLVISNVNRGFPTPKQSAALRDWVERGGTLLVLGGSAEREAEISGLLGKSYVVKAETAPLIPRYQTHDVVKTGAYPLLDGISNGDLHWGGAPVAVPFVRISGPGARQLVDVPVMTEIDMGSGRMLVCQIPLAESFARETLSERIGSILLTNIHAPLAPSAELSLSQDSKVTFIDLHAFANMGFKDDVAGDKKGGWTDQGPADLRTVPVGGQTFRGVQFDIIDPAKNDGKSCIVLRGQDRPYFPASADRIQAQGKFDKLYFLVANAWTTAVPQAKLIVRYVDLFTEEIPIRGGVEVADWVSPAHDLGNAKVAWEGNNGTSSATVYLVEWNNPKKDNEITDISFTSEGNGVPILLAVTGVRD